MRQKKYALIWWVNSREKDVVALSVIPKKDRIINKMTTLSWKDDKSKKKALLEAKLLKISCDESELHKTIVTDKGEIHNMSEKIMPSEIVEEERNISQGQKIAETVSRSCKKKLEEKIKNTKTALQMLDSNLLTVSDKQHPEISSKQQAKLPISVNESAATSYQQTQHSILQTPVSRESQYSSQYQSDSDIHHHSVQQPVAVNTSLHTPFNETNSNIPENVPQQPRTIDVTQHLIQYQHAPNVPQNSTHQPAVLNMSQYSSQNETSPNMYQYPQQPAAIPVSQNFQNTYNGYNTNNTSGLLSVPEYTYLGKMSYHRKPNYSVMPSSNSITNSEEHINKARNFNSTNTDHDRLIEHSDNDLQSQQSTSTSQTLHFSEIPVTQNNDQAESNSESDDDDRDDRKTETAKNSITLPFKVTPSFVNFLKTLHDCFASILEENKIEEEGNTKRAENFQISPRYLTGGGTKVEIYEGCGFWLEKHQNDWVNLKISGHESDWHLLTREILAVVYGKRLSEYSATGLRSSRPRIHPKLYEGLFKRVNKIASTTIQETIFISFINKECGNRRKSKKKNQNE